MPIVEIAAVADPAEPSSWPDTPSARRAARDAIRSLELRLRAEPSATLVLETWCVLHGLAPAGTHIVADRLTGFDKPATAEVRALLRVDRDAAVRYRRVRLRCGTLVLSQADNWYVPGRLTAAMNAVLDNTDTPFGRVVAPLRFGRRTIASLILWSPSLDAPARTTPLIIPAALLETRALLSMPDGTPISLVVETYSSDILAFPPPAS
ncbi:hypothetical protein [uncultured Sphingomonas sp.]|uniref:hypothetical protein n=1 Tax=uncultured Sphingomonas sp. TaxID=158754 RepID=UPI0035CA5F3A